MSGNAGKEVSTTLFFILDGKSLTSITSRYKSWKLMALHPFVAVMFTVGYALREVGAFDYKYDAKNSQSLIVYIMNQVLVYVGP